MDDIKALCPKCGSDRKASGPIEHVFRSMFDEFSNSMERRPVSTTYNFRCLYCGTIYAISVPVDPEQTRQTTSN